MRLHVIHIGRTAGHSCRKLSTVVVRLATLAAALALLQVGAGSALAALSAEGDILYAQVNASTYRYSLDLQNNGTTTIGTFWYSWIPGEDFLPTSPTNIVSPAGWTPTITGGGANNGFAIQWTTNSPVAAGTVLSGFGFDSADAPTQLLGTSPTHTSEPVGTTFVYVGAPLADPGFQFQVDPVAHPWSNPLNPLDANRDGAVTPLDALVVIDDLNANGVRALPLLPPIADAPPPFIDTNADDQVSPLDALLVIDDLNALTLTSAEHSASIELAVSVPEPSAVALAAVGFAILAVTAVARRLRSHRPVYSSASVSR